MASLKEPIPVWDMKEWDTTKEPERGGGDGDGGTKTIQYYFEEDVDDGNPSSPAESGFQSTVPSVSPSWQNIPVEIGPPVDCKTYDFTHSEAERDYILTDGELYDYESSYNADEKKVLKRYVISEGLRTVMKDYYKITHRERLAAVLNPKGSFPLCPRGDCADSIVGAYRSRRHPGPFLTCSFSDSHECGDEFYKVVVDTKPLPDFEPTMRPPHFKEKKAKFFKQCKHCESLGFIHHRNPAQHYEDYVNTVTYNKHKNQAKIWQQHLADLKFSLSNRDPQYEEITEKCSHYRPSPIIIHATRYSRAPCSLRKKTTGSVLSRKRASLIRRPSYNRKSSAKSTASRPPSRMSDYQDHQFMRPTSSSEAKKATINPEEDDEIEFIVQAGSLKKKDKLREAHRHDETTGPTQLEKSSSSAKINKIAVKRTTSLTKEGMKVSMAKLIRFRQAQPRLPSASTRRNARPNLRKINIPMPHPHLPPQHALIIRNHAKYIPKLKPNISAKFLRKQRSKENPSVKKIKSVMVPTTSGKSIKNKVFKSVKALKDKEHESEDESYAQFRDQNGNFDSEKYRRSILKMLEKGSGARRERRKKETRSERHGLGTAPALPKIKNPYRNVKSKTASNLPQGKQKKKSRKGSTGEVTLESLFGKTIGEISNKYTSERYVGMIREKDDRFSVPGFDDMW